MRSVRLFYEKRGVMRFCSHLDVTRYMTRLIRRARLPVWHTEGFNPRPYVTFALPLSLGQESGYEIMNVRITDDALDISALPERLNAFCHEGIRFFDAKEAVMKPADLALADYRVVFEDGGELSEKLTAFLNKSEITVTKRTKHGGEKQMDIKEHIKNAAVEETAEGTVLTFTLPAGGSLNINPELPIGAFLSENGNVFYTVERTALKTADGKLFV